MEINDVIQFNQNHKWCGCFGIITEIKDCKENGIRYMVGVPIPQERNSLYICNEYRKCNRENRNSSANC